MQVPEGWKYIPLEQVAKVTSGGTPSRNKPSYWDGNIPWIRTTEVQNCYLYPEDTKEFITEEGVRDSAAKLVPSGTILLAMIGQGKTRGQVALLKFDAATNQNCAAIILNDTCEPVFIYNYLLAQYDAIRGSSNSAGQSNLNGSIVKSIKVPVPPLQEQQKIAQILSTWDKAITTTEQLLANSQQQKKALMQQLLTGKKRLLDDNGQRFSGEWKLKEIGTFLKESRIPSVDNNPEKRITVRLNLNGMEPREFRGTEAIDSTAHFVRKAGQFIYGKQNIHKGAFGIISNHLDNYETSQDLPAFDFLGSCDPLWFFYYMSQNHFYAGLENKMTGTGSKRLNPKEFYKVGLLTPPISEQQKIATVLTTADNEITQLQQKLDQLKQEKKALMQQLLTGKRRVKVEEVA